MFDTIQEIFGELRRNRLRTIATGFAVSSGLFLLIVLQGAGNGLIHSFTENMGQFAFDAIRIYGGRTTKPFQGIKEGRPIQLDDRDIEMSKRTFPNQVSNVMPALEQNGCNMSFLDNHISADLYGVYPPFLQLEALQILEGRFINNIDIDQTRKVIVIDDGTVKDLFKNHEHPIGQNVKIGNISYKIVGVYKGDEMRNGNTGYIPYSTLSVIYNRGRYIDEMAMTIKNIPTDSAMNKFMDDYIRASSHIHTFDPTDTRALWIRNQAGDAIQMNNAMDILHQAFFILGLLTLVSGIVGVSNIMLISVKERTREFGIRRAIGARPWSIIRMVILESVIITSIFGYIGMLLGIFFCEWMDKAVGGQTMDLGVFQAKYFVDPTVDLSICIQATIVIIIAGALAGFFPARKAVKVKPVEALSAS